MFAEFLKNSRKHEENNCTPNSFTLKFQIRKTNNFCTMHTRNLCLNGKLWKKKLMLRYTFLASFKRFFFLRKFLIDINYFTKSIYIIGTIWEVTSDADKDTCTHTIKSLTRERFCRVCYPSNNTLPCRHSHVSPLLIMLSVLLFVCFPFFEEIEPPIFITLSLSLSPPPSPPLQVQ